MGTSPDLAAFLLEQLTGAAPVSLRKMFGEYALYCEGKLVALLCDDTLFVKPTAAGRSFLGNPAEAPPYPGAKPHYQIDPDRWDDAEWLCALIRTTAGALPAPKPKPARKPR
jgi:TfoX/Sxy family transcriptional regulator of competence genes